MFEDSLLRKGQRPSRGTGKIAFGTCVCLGVILLLVLVITFGAVEIAKLNKLNNNFKEQNWNEDLSNRFSWVAPVFENDTTRGEAVFFVSNSRDRVEEYCPSLDSTDPCYIPIEKGPLLSDEGTPRHHVEISGDDTRIRIRKTGFYNLLISVGSSFHPCPYARRLIALYDVTSGDILQTVLISNVVSQKINITTLFNAGTELAFMVVEPERADVRGGKVYISGVIIKEDFYDTQKELTNEDLNLKVRWVPSRPTGLPIVPIAYPDQYPTSSSQFIWKSPIIPWKAHQVGVQLDGTQSDYYQKCNSIQKVVLFNLGINPNNISCDDPRLSIFLTNLEDRGPNNARKKFYMTGLLSQVVSLYGPKMDTFLNKVYALITTYQKPVLSSFRSELIKFFLNVHVGEDDYPQYVIDYFSRFEDNIASAQPQTDLGAIHVAEEYLAVESVKAYFAAKNTEVQAKQDKTCLLYYWNKAGLHPDGLVMEAVHNIQAFAQYTNVLYLVIMDKLSGTVIPNTPPSTVTYDFFAKYAAVTTDADKLNVVREIFRLLVPNQVSFSHTQSPDIPSGVNVQGRHLHKSIGVYAMATMTGNAASYFNYNPSLYTASFQTDFTQFDNSWLTNDMHESYNPADYFTVSTVDSETLLDRSNPKLIPVFPLPIYPPFGLGYRRCPGEPFNYLTIMKTMDRFTGLTFQISTSPDVSTVSLAPFTIVEDNIYTVAA